ncbi:hypothetical protein TNCV_1501051 [Trichonephila clavipes]|uniref:Uncharacterized protein n=1 Tax=Trichonephila clavipes TaxID=2585209 RepID=A0A8X6RT09_TRICX|nr:hypothetical protein TNCV_1501051 [Trichonephila clavipes]
MFGDVLGNDTRMVDFQPWTPPPPSIEKFLCTPVFLSPVIRPSYQQPSGYGHEIIAERCRACGLGSCSH